MWGPSSSNLFLVGRLGTIVHYDGTGFHKIESGTTTDINDIWGALDIETEKYNIYCVVTNRLAAGEKRILQIHEDFTVTDALNWDIDKELTGIWFSSYSPVYVSGGGVYVESDTGWVKQQLPSYHYEKVRGVNNNDVMVAGAFGRSAHFNGVDWKVYPELFSSLGALPGMAMEEDFVVLTGSDLNRPIVAFGLRQ